MKVGDKVVSKVDCFKIHKDHIYIIHKIIGLLIYVEYSDNHQCYVFHLKPVKPDQRYYARFSDYFYTTKEMRKIKLEKLKSL